MLVDYKLVETAIALHPEWNEAQIQDLYNKINAALDTGRNIEERKEAADEVNDFTELLVVDLTFRT